MLIIPAIDLQDGCVVRYVQGRMDKKIYSRDPAKTAKHWVKQGAKFIHVVDLDGAFTGVPKNLSAVREIIATVNVPVQFGGGVRSIDTIKSLLKAGLSRVVLGTRAVEDKGFLKKAFNEFEDKVIVSIDAKAGIVQVKGWKAAHKGLNMLVFAKTLKDLGFEEVIYTDTTKDGTLSGPNIIGVKSIMKATGLKVIASGGVSRLEDLYKLEKLEKDGLTGVIIGKALYEGKFTLTQAVKFVS